MRRCTLLVVLLSAAIAIQCLASFSPLDAKETETELVPSGIFASNGLSDSAAVVHVHTKTNETKSGETINDKELDQIFEEEWGHQQNKMLMPSEEHIVAEDEGEDWFDEIALARNAQGNKMYTHDSPDDQELDQIFEEEWNAVRLADVDELDQIFEEEWNAVRQADVEYEDDSMDDAVIDSDLLAWGEDVPVVHLKKFFKKVKRKLKKLGRKLKPFLKRVLKEALKAGLKEGIRVGVSNYKGVRGHGSLGSRIKAGIKAGARAGYRTGIRSLKSRIPNKKQLKVELKRGLLRGLRSGVKAAVNSNGSLRHRFHTGFKLGSRAGLASIKNARFTKTTKKVSYKGRGQGRRPIRSTKNLYGQRRSGSYVKPSVHRGRAQKARAHQAPMQRARLQKYRTQKALALARRVRGAGRGARKVSKTIWNGQRRDGTYRKPLAANRRNAKGARGGIRPWNSKGGRKGKGGIKDRRNRARSMKADARRARGSFKKPSAFGRGHGKSSKTRSRVTGGRKRSGIRYA